MILKSSKWTHDRRRYTIESLRFAEMHLRRDSIPEAYTSTFSWFFTNGSPFRAWLTNDHKVFWITGKAGSGKSTAMKYLTSHPRTMELLSACARSRKIILAQNYMWNPGLAIQHNKEGMLQEILFHILKADPDLVNVITKSRWHDGLETLERTDTWTSAELIEVLHCIFEHSLQRNYYCLFIDGLDEYEGEHARLIELISAISTHGNVKVCISSRPWNVFCNAFDKLHDKIYIHELTRGDIYTYITGELGKVLRVDSLVEELISAIISKARGVFLWVYLVVRSLREGFEEGDSVEIMRHRVDEFPADLEHYFHHILRRLSKTYRRHTVQTLSLAVKILGQDGVHRIRDCDSFLPFWLLGEGFLDPPSFAFEYLPHHANASRLHAMSEATRKHLNACCKDFLFVTEAPQAQALHGLQGCSLDNNHKVEFLHRTVYDFLRSPAIQELLNQEVPRHFHDILFPVHVALTQNKVKGIHDEHFCQSCSRALCSAIKLVPSIDDSLQTMIAFEELALELLDFACREDCCYQALANVNLLEDMCIIFASYKLRLFIRKALDRFPDCLWNMERVGNAEVLRQTLGLSSRRPFPIAQIDVQLLEIVLQAGEYREFHLRKFARRIGEKALYEAPSWTESDVRHVAKVVEHLTYHGLQIDVLPIELIQKLERYTAFEDTTTSLQRSDTVRNARVLARPYRGETFWGYW